MPGELDDDGGARRSVVPPAAGRSLWAAAAWTGLGTALLGAFIAIAVVAICWLPAAGRAGGAGSALRAGLLTFLTALHGGVTIDGLHAAFVPLGMTVLVALIARRAGYGLADVADSLAERRAARLAWAAALQVGVFTGGCALGAASATLGTSSAAVAPTVLAAAVLFALTGTVAFVRASALGEEVAHRVPTWLAPAGRAAAAGVVAYAALGAVLVAGALVVHHDRVAALTDSVGGGWSSLPLLVISVLCAPNAVVAGAAYLSGPGFALGSGTHVSAWTTAHGTLPALPLLGAVPAGDGATWPVWVLIAATAPAVGCAVAFTVRTEPGWVARLRAAMLGSALAGCAAALLGWLGGGAIGDGRLAAVGASPWRLGIAIGVELAVASTVALGALGVAAGVRAAAQGAKAAEAGALVPDDVAAAVTAPLPRIAAAQPRPDAAHDDRLAG